MKTDVTPAIIMRVRKMGESDLLVTFFTPHKGQLKGVAKGAMKSCKRFVNALDLFSLVHLEYAPRRQGNLYLLHSGKLLNAYPEVRRNFSSLSKASFMIELTGLLFPPGVTEPKIFELLSQAFGALSRSKRGDLIPLVFELKAMALGGYRIDTTKCSKCGRRYQGEGMAVFTREGGGITCLKCRQPTSVSPPLNPATVKAVETLLNEAFEEVIESNLAENTIQDLRSILKLHREYQLEQRLRTSKYVD